MTKMYGSIFVLLLMTGLGSSMCPTSKMHGIGICSFRVHCIGTIRGVGLPHECQGSVNFPVNIELILTDPIERFDDRLNKTDFLNVVTSFRASGKWPETNLSILQYMPRLKNLYLFYNRMKRISGSPFFYLKRLEIIDLSHNTLSDFDDLFVFETQPKRLHKLSLAYNVIEEIPSFAFDELKSLKELDLSHNFISDLSEEPFLNLTSLEILRLNNNRIKDLNGALNDLKNLKHLYLRGNQIHNIDVKSLQIIYHLETFDISGNQLNELRPIVFLRHWKHFEGHSVCKIILSENHITVVPNATSEISSRFTRDLTSKLMRKNSVDILTELDLSKNSITDIQFNAFQSIVKLVSLDLSHNKLIDFIVNADDLVNVKYLNLSNNFVINLYFKSFYSMTNLQHLDLSYNLLNYIPEQTFSNNYNLKFVNMSHNEIKHLEQINIKIFNSDGGMLDLSNNGLSRLSVTLEEGLRLTVLALHSNNITDMELIDLHYQRELRNLDLSHNYIENLDESALKLPVSLVYLNLSRNEITKIAPSTFKRIGHLRSLYLSHNKLENIEYGTFLGLAALSNLDLSYNNIRYLDSNIFIDLKQLSFLSLTFNAMVSLDYKLWLTSKQRVTVYMEGNNFSCEWLGSAVNNFNNGYSNMRPAVHQPTLSGHSLEGIPCIPKEVGELYDPNTKPVMTDERLLATSQKILEVVREQTHWLRKYIAFAMKEKNKIPQNAIEQLIKK